MFNSLDTAGSATSMILSPSKSLETEGDGSSMRNEPRADFDPSLTPHLPRFTRRTQVFARRQKGFFYYLALINKADDAHLSLALRTSERVCFIELIK